jgi:hypothetical protein
MQESTGRGNAGLDKPARKRRGADVPLPGAIDGGEESAGGKQEPNGGAESASGAAAAFPLIDPLDIPASAGSGDDGGASDQPRKRRGRKPGGHNRTKEAEAVQNLSSLLKIEKILVASAFFLSNIAASPELVMEPEQAKDIREAIEELARLYPIGISEKKVAWTNFIFAVGGWAGPGLIAIYKRPRPAGPRVVPQPIREAAKPAESPAAATPLGMVNGLANPVTGAGAHPSEAKTPQQMWNQGGEIPETDGE